MRVSSLPHKAIVQEVRCGNKGSTHCVKGREEAICEVDGLVQEHLVLLSGEMIRRQQASEDADRDLLERGEGESGRK